MTRFALPFICLAALGLSSCAGLTEALKPGGAGAQVLQNLDGCKRTYRGAIGAGVTGSFDIECDPKPQATAPASTSDDPIGDILSQSSDRANP